MNKSESKYFNTALCIDEALIDLLEEKDSEYITVKEICKKAGVNRSTFYLHYETIADLINETAETVNKRFLSYFSERSSDCIGKINDAEPKDLVFVTNEYLLPYLQFIVSNKNIYRAAYRNPDYMQVNARYKNLKKYIIEPILKRFDIPDKLHKYYISYYIEGIAAVIREWLNNDCRDEVETIAAVIVRCVRPIDDLSA